MAGDNDEDRSEDHDDETGDEEEDDIDLDDTVEDDDDPDSDDVLLERLLERVGERLEAVVDERVRGPLRGMRRELRQIQRPGKESPSRKGSRRDEDDEDVRPVADVRAARTAAREYLADSGVSFISDDERKLAMDLVQGHIASRAADGFDDEDEVGREAARNAAETVKKLRKLYQRDTVAKLRKRGALVKPKGQPSKGSSAVGAESEWKKGQEIAKRFGAGDQKTT